MKYWLSILGLFALIGFLIYGHTLTYEFVRWDDGLLIFDNPAIRGITLQNLKTIFTTYDPELYIPLSLLSYQVDYMIGGSNPAIYHFTNLILHILNAVLVCGVMKLLTKNTWIAVVTGLLFLVHPLHTEAVVWASARKDLLSTFFFLGSFVLYVQQKNQKSVISYRGSVVLFLAALLSKVTVLGLPLILFIYNWIRDGKITKNSLLELLPYFGLSAFFAVIAMFGKTGVLSSSTPLETILMSAKGTMFYIEKLLLPINLSVLYPYNEPIQLTSPTFLIPLLLLPAALVSAAFFSWKHKRSPALALAPALFLITLAPSLLNFAKGGTYYIASDRYAYIPSIGIIALVVILIFKLPYKSVVAGVLVCFAAFGASAQSRVWANSDVLFRNVLAHYPQSHVAHNNLGNIYRRNGDIDAAIAAYNESLEITLPLNGSRARAQTLSNLASAYRAQGNLSKAVELFTEAHALDPLNPQVHVGRAIVYQQLGRYEDAEAGFLTAIELQPNLAVAYINLGALYKAQNKTEAAIAEYEKAITYNPLFPQAYYNLGIALRSMARNREAKEAFEKAVDLEPSFIAARINLGILYAERKDIEEAIAQFEAVLTYDPDNAQALSALAQLRM